MVLCASMFLSFHVFAQLPQLEGSASPESSAKGETSEKQPPLSASSQPVLSEPPVRDVFQSELRPLETPAVATPDQPVEIQTNLEGLSMSARGSRAIINGEVYKEGEEKLGIKVLQIRKKEVDILINQAIKRTLSMLPKETRDVPYASEKTNLSSEEGGEADTSINEGQAQDEKPVYV